MEDISEHYTLQSQILSTFFSQYANGTYILLHHRQALLRELVRRTESSWLTPAITFLRTCTSPRLWPEIKQELHLVSPQVLFHTLKRPREDSSKFVTYINGFTPVVALEFLYSKYTGPTTGRNCVSGEAGDGRFIVKLCFCIKHMFFSQSVGFYEVTWRKGS